MLCIVEQARFIFPKHPPVAVCQDPCGFLFARSQPHWILEPLFFRPKDSTAGRNPPLPQSTHALRTAAPPPPDKIKLI